MNNKKHKKAPSRSDYRFIFGFGIAIIGMVWIGYFMLESVQQVKDTSNHRAEARNVAFKLKALAAFLVDAETGQRGYLLTENSDYLTPYRKAMSQIDTLYTELESDLQLQPEQLKRLQAAKIHMDEKKKELVNTVLMAEQGKAKQAIEVVRTNVGRKHMITLREIFTEMDHEQQAVIQARNQRMEYLAERSKKVLFWGSCAAIFLVIFMLILLVRNHNRRTTVENYLKNLNKELEKQKNIFSNVIKIQNEVATSSLDSKTMMGAVVKYSQELTGADGSIIEVLEGSDLVYHHAEGAAIPFLNMRIPIKGSFSGLCLESESALICNDSEEDTRVNREACRKINVRSMVVAPLKHGGRTIGVLKNFSSTPYFFANQTFDAFKLINGILSAGISQALEFEEKIMAIIDLEKTKSELTVSRDQAEAATIAKSRFLANMTHEVRTPLNGIIGMTDLILEGALDHQQREYAEAIKASGKGLLQVVNDILDFSKIEAGRLTFEKQNFNLKHLLQEVSKSFQFATQQKGIELILNVSSEIPELLSGDAGRIRQVLMNLIGNAIKFTSSGHVKTIVSLVNHTSTHIRFDITDTGIGMSEENMKNLFQEFVQADTSTTRKYGGTGLGLSICKRLVEQMSGTIGVNSKLGMGSTFWFTLQLDPANIVSLDSSRKHVEEFPTRKEPWRVLVAEDNKVNQIIITKQLEKFGFKIDMAENGRQAVEKFSTSQYDLILMDCHMPEMDGYEASKQIRSMDIRIPIIAVTASAMESDKVKTQQAGMSDHISKPLDKDAFRAILIKWTTYILENQKKQANG